MQPHMYATFKFYLIVQATGCMHRNIMSWHISLTSKYNLRFIATSKIFLETI